MGQVWQAADEVLGRPVAVKLLRPEYAEHPETLERFRSEARHAGALSHPHIAQVYDYGHGYDRGDAGPFRDPYLVLEYVDGPSLADLIERGPLDADLTRDIIAQAADGLAAAHRVGLVHRDVKPGNLLLTSDGRVKITDFGVAHAVGAAPITAPGIVMGTALYMAPERVAGRAGTPASDLYSLGVVMYECLSGVPPFRGTSPDVMAAHLHLPLPALPDQVPESLADLVAKLTAKDPSYRISDAAVLAARLRALEPAGTGGRRWPPEPRPHEVPQGDPGQRGDRDWLGVPYYLIDPQQPGGLVSPAAGYLSSAYPSSPDGGQALPGRLSVPWNRGRPAATVSPARPARTGEAHGPLAVAADDAPAVIGHDVVAPEDEAVAGAYREATARRAGQVTRRPDIVGQGIVGQGIVAVVTIAMVAGLAVTGLAASGAFRAAPVAIRGATRPSATGTSPGYVQVPAGSLSGQQVATVIRRLSALGLTPKITWASHTGQPAGTVVSVTPNGPVPAGGTVTVTTAYDSATPPAAVRVPGMPGTIPTTTAPLPGQRRRCYDGARPRMRVSRDAP
jgi:eukaryotic-like serine/threonine-protein kinase